MGLAGLFYAAIVVGWAAYLVPLWLRRHDEEAAASSVDRFSTEMQVLARRSSAGTAADAGPLPVPSATRRRRVLVGLLVVTTICLGLSMMGLVPSWGVGITVGLDVAFLFFSARASAAERTRRRVQRETGAAVPVAEDDLEGVEVPAEPEVVIAELPEEYLSGAGSDASKEGLWEPREVPLPTYVTKPKAPAPTTARRIELGSSESFTSARFSSAESETLLDESERAPTGIADELYDREQYDDFDDRRVVGD